MSALHFLLLTSFLILNYARDHYTGNDMDDINVTYRKYGFCFEDNGGEGIARNFGVKLSGDIYVRYSGQKCHVRSEKGRNR